MKWTPMDEDLRIHQKLEDEPNDVGGLSAQALKEKFDHAGLSIQKYLNEVHLPEEESAAADLLSQAKAYADKKAQNLETGNMKAGVYDPENRKQDVFAYVDGKLAEMKAQMGSSCSVFVGTGYVYHNMTSQKTVKDFTEITDPDGLWSTTENAFVVPQGGKMAVALVRTHAANNQGTEGRVHLMVNGQEQSMRTTPPGYANGTWKPDMVMMGAAVTGGDRVTLAISGHKNEGVDYAVQIEATDVCVLILK